jgi:hypothetical protein
MPVPHDALAPVRQTQALQLGQERLGFGLHSLNQQAPSSAPQNRRQRILDRFRLTQGNNGVIARHGVSLLWEVPAGSSPASIRRLSHPGITQIRA